MPPEDEKTSQETKPEGEEKDKSLETSEAATETAEGEESEEKPSKAQKRIQQLAAERDQAANIVQWYRENIGDPNDVVEFRKWRDAQIAKAKEQEAEGEISPAKLRQIRELMRKADPEYAEFLDRNKAEQEARSEAQFDSAEDQIRELAANEFGLKTKADEDDISWLAQQTMLAIQNDAKLLRQWQVGNLDCVKKGFKIVQERQEKLGKSVTKLRQQAIDKRKISRLPTLPSAQGAATGEKAGAKTQEKGITKSTHEDAWALLQQTLQE